MKENHRVAGAAGGALGLGAFAAIFGTCCVAPWTIGLLGVAGAVTLARLAFLQPYLIAGSVILLGLTFWWAYRPLPACADGTCEADSRRSLRIMAWLSCALMCVMVAATWLHWRAIFH